MTTQQTIWQTALKKLKSKPISSYEMKFFLQRKFPESGTLILDAIEELERVKLLDDEKLLEQWINHLIQKPIGRLKIQNEIKKRGLDTDKIDEYLKQKNWIEEESGKKAMEVKGRTLSETHPQKRKQKMMMFLRSRGFQERVIYHVIKD